MLGLLDDLILLPAGIWLAVRLIPPELMAEHREAATRAQSAPVSRVAALAIVALWIAGIVLAIWLLARWL